MSIIVGIPPPGVTDLVVVRPAQQIAVLPDALGQRGRFGRDGAVNGLCVALIELCNGR